MAHQTDYDVQFRIAEYAALREELLSHIEAIKAIETETVIGIGAVYAWLLSTYSWRNPVISVFVAVIPAMLTVVNMCRVRDRQQRIRRIAHYIRSLEDLTTSSINVHDHLEHVNETRWINYRRTNNRRFMSGWEEFIVAVREQDQARVVGNSLIESLHAFTTRRFFVETYHKILWPFLIAISVLSALLLIYLHDPPAPSGQRAAARAAEPAVIQAAG